MGLKLLVLLGLLNIVDVTVSHVHRRNDDDVVVLSDSDSCDSPTSNAISYLGMELR